MNTIMGAKVIRPLITQWKPIIFFRSTPSNHVEFEQNSYITQSSTPCQKCLCSFRSHFKMSVVRQIPKVPWYVVTFTVPTHSRQGVSCGTQPQQTPLLIPLLAGHQVPQATIQSGVIKRHFKGLSAVK